MSKKDITADEAMERLISGNKTYLTAKTGSGDISLERRKQTLAEGQHPYAVLLCCSDSRVIPEEIFSAGIGELFVIRVAGNVVGNHALGSIQYAVEHLGCKLVVVLGHTHCGAVDAAIHHDPSGYILFITDQIREAIGEEQDDYRACRLNVEHSRRVVEQCLKNPGNKAWDKVRVTDAVYHLENGEVEFLDGQPFTQAP